MEPAQKERRDHLQPYKERKGRSSSAWAPKLRGGGSTLNFREKDGGGGKAEGDGAKILIFVTLDVKPNRFQLRKGEKDKSHRHLRGGKRSAGGSLNFIRSNSSRLLLPQKGKAPG